MAGDPQAYDSRHLKPPEHFQNALPLSTAGDASFFRSRSGEGLSEPATEFPAEGFGHGTQATIWEVQGFNLTARPLVRHSCRPLTGCGHLPLLLIKLLLASENQGRTNPAILNHSFA